MIPSQWKTTRDQPESLYRNGGDNAGLIAELFDLAASFHHESCRNAEPRAFEIYLSALTIQTTIVDLIAGEMSHDDGEMWLVAGRAYLAALARTRGTTRHVWRRR